jgi:hypothetical protein
MRDLGMGRLLGVTLPGDGGSLDCVVWANAWSCRHLSNGNQGSTSSNVSCFLQIGGVLQVSFTLIVQSPQGSKSLPRRLAARGETLKAGHLWWGPLYTRERPFVHDLAADRQMLVFGWRLKSESGMDWRWEWADL